MLDLFLNLFLLFLLLALLLFFVYFFFYTTILRLSDEALIFIAVNKSNFNSEQVKEILDKVIDLQPYEDQYMSLCSWYTIHVGRTGSSSERDNVSQVEYYLEHSDIPCTEETTCIIFKALYFLAQRENIRDLYLNSFGIIADEILEQCPPHIRLFAKRHRHMIPSIICDFPTNYFNYRKFVYLYRDNDNTTHEAPPIILTEEFLIELKNEIYRRIENKKDNNSID